MPHLTALPSRPLGPLGLLGVAELLARRVRRWSVESQQGSRRNAMTASTVLAARRAERDDVEAFLRGEVHHRVPDAVRHG